MNNESQLEDIIDDNVLIQVQDNVIEHITYCKELVDELGEILEKKDLDISNFPDVNSRVLNIVDFIDSINPKLGLIGKSDNKLWDNFSKEKELKGKVKIYEELLEELQTIISKLDIANIDSKLIQEYILGSFSDNEVLHNYKSFKGTIYNEDNSTIEVYKSEDVDGQNMNGEPIQIIPLSDIFDEYIKGKIEEGLGGIISSLQQTLEKSRTEPIKENVESVLTSEK